MTFVLGVIFSWWFYHFVWEKRLKPRWALIRYALQVPLHLAPRPADSPAGAPTREVPSDSGKTRELKPAKKRTTSRADDIPKPVDFGLTGKGVTGNSWPPSSGRPN